MLLWCIVCKLVSISILYACVYVSERACVCLPPHPIWSFPCVVWPPVLKPINPTYTDSSHAVAVPHPTGITPFALKGSILFEDWSVGPVNTHSYPDPNIRKWCIQIMSIISLWLYECDLYIKKMSFLNDIFFLNVVSALDCYRAALAYHRYIIIGLRFFDMNTFLEISIRMHLDL